LLLCFAGRGEGDFEGRSITTVSYSYVYSQRLI
jgi:hypothetical protein